MEAVIKQRKSARLSKEETKALRFFMRKFTSAVEASENIGISRQVLERVVLISRGSPDTIDKIRAAIGSSHTNVIQENA